MALGERVFVDTGAWIGLAVDGDPHHESAVRTWATLGPDGARPWTSVAVVMETFTFLDRTTSRQTAVRWQRTLDGIAWLHVLEVAREDLATAWRELADPRVPRLSVVDATSFALMRRHGIRRAFAFDAHFFAAGFLPA